MSKFRATVTADVRSKIKQPKLVAKFKKELAKLKGCGERLDLLAQTFTGLPPLHKTGANIKVWFRAIQTAFHPDKFVGDPMRPFAATTAAWVNTCVQSQARWLIKYRAAGPKKKKSAAAAAGPEDDEAFNRERASYFKHLVERQKAAEAKKKRAAAAARAAETKRRKKTRATLDKWFTKMSNNAREVKQKFDIKAGVYVAKKRAVGKKARRAGFGKRVTVFETANKSELKRLLPDSSDYRTFVRWLLSYLPRTVKYAGVRGLLIHHGDEIALIAEETGIPLPPVRAEVELHAIQLTEEFVLRQQGRQRSRFFDDESILTVEQRERKRAKGLASKKRSQLLITG